MTTPYESQTEHMRDVLSRVDTAVISRAADQAEFELEDHHFALIDLQPGDSTRYLVTILDVRDAVAFDAEFVVSLANNSFRTYLWDGQHVHWTYVAHKWAADAHSAVIIAELLNDISALRHPAP